MSGLHTLSHYRNVLAQSLPVTLQWKVSMGYSVIIVVGANPSQRRSSGVGALGHCWLGCVSFCVCFFISKRRVILQKLQGPKLLCGRVWNRSEDAFTVFANISASHTSDAVRHLLGLVLCCPVCPMLSGARGEWSCMLHSLSLSSVKPAPVTGIFIKGCI